MTKPRSRIWRRLKTKQGYSLGWLKVKNNGQPLPAPDVALACCLACRYDYPAPPGGFVYFAFSLDRHYDHFHPDYDPLSRRDRLSRLLDR